MLGTKEDFELIRQQINIEAVANHLMKKQGKNYIFPSEKSASVRIYPETQSFYDFGRCTGGDVIRLPGVPEQIQPTMFVGCGTRADQGDFECKIKNRVPVSLPCVPDRDGNSANRKVIVLSFIASLL